MSHVKHARGVHMCAQVSPQIGRQFHGMPDVGFKHAGAVPAQVSLPIVRQFVGAVEREALGVKVLKGVRPDQQLVKVVNDELVKLMGGQAEDLVDPKEGPQARARMRPCALLLSLKGMSGVHVLHKTPILHELLRLLRVRVTCAGDPDGGPAGRGEDDGVRQAGARAAEAPEARAHGGH
jgi:hypothetical protein